MPGRGRTGQVVPSASCCVSLFRILANHRCRRHNLRRQRMSSTTTHTVTTLLRSDGFDSEQHAPEATGLNRLVSELDLTIPETTAWVVDRRKRFAVRVVTGLRSV